MNILVPFLYTLYCWNAYLLPEAWIRSNFISRIRTYVLDRPQRAVESSHSFAVDDIIYMERVMDLPFGKLTSTKLEQFRVALLAKPIFTIANIAWVLSAIGIVVSLIPSVMFVYPFFEPYLRWIFEIKILWEIMAYACCILFLKIAYNTPDTHIVSRNIIAFTGVSFSYLSFCITCYLHEETPDWYVWIFWMISSAPMALLFDSSLVGFASVLSLFGALSFVVIPLGGGYLLGTEDIPTTERVAAASISFIVIFLFAPNLNILNVFRGGMYVLGPVAYGVSGLIMSCSFRESNFLSWVFAPSLVFLYLSNIAPIKVSSVVFIVLYCIEQLLIFVKGGAWLVVMGCSILVWLCTWTHTNN